MEIILASQSPFRKHALDILGLTYSIIPSHIDESMIRDNNPERRVRLLSQAKCEKIAQEHKNAIIISADLFVVYKNKIFEKPRNTNQAAGMLKTFSGHSLTILTGLAVLNSAIAKLRATTESCRVHFRKLTDFEIQDYIKRYPVTTFAGAFEADGLLRFADSVIGNYNFKAALPVDKLILFLRENGIAV